MTEQDEDTELAQLDEEIETLFTAPRLGWGQAIRLGMNRTSEEHRARKNADQRERAEHRRWGPKRDEVLRYQREWMRAYRKRYRELHPLPPKAPAVMPSSNTPNRFRNWYAKLTEEERAAYRERQRQRYRDRTPEQIARERERDQAYYLRRKERKQNEGKTEANSNSRG